MFFTLKGIISLFKKKNTKNDTPVKVSVGELIQKDSNSNGIPDWEEYLWGLNPNKNGPENKEFILSKKNTLSQNNETISSNDSNLSVENDTLSKEFFATIISLQQTGSLDSESMNSISNAIGDNVKTIEIDDIYTNSMMKIENDSIEANKKYHDDLTKLVSSYSDSDIGNELTFVIQGLSNKDKQALSLAKTIAVSYQKFGKDLVKIPVPKVLASLQLSAANNYEKTGQTINSLTLMLNDPLGGMKALLNYKKYNDALSSDLEKISEILQ